MTCVDIVQSCVNKDTFDSVRSDGVIQTEMVETSMFPTNINKVTAEGLPLMGSEDFAYYLKERPGCFIIVGTKEDTFTNLTKFTFDRQEATDTLNSCIALHNSKKNSMIRGEQDGEEGRKNIDTEDQIESENSKPQGNSSTKNRSNCCAHGSTFDFNDNVLPSIISLFLNIASDRLIEDNLKRKLFKENVTISEEGIFVSNRN